MVRLYAHGGALGGLLGTRFLGAGRMLEEFRVHLHALRRGVPTCVPVALRIERHGPLVTAHYVTRKVVDAVDLVDFVDRIPTCPLPGAERLARSVADAVAGMHDAGILHADLNLRNLLVAQGVRRGAGHRLRQGAPADRRSRSTSGWATSTASTAQRRSGPPRGSAVGLLDRLRVLRAYLGRYPDWHEREADVARAYRGVALHHRLFHTSLL